MFRRLPKYEKIVQLDGKWYSAQPAHWRKAPLRALAIERIKRNYGGDDRYLSLTAKTGVIPYGEKGNIGNKKPEDLSRCKVVAAGDMVLNSMNFQIGSYGRSRYDGVCSSVYIVLRPRGAAMPSYLDCLFQINLFQRYAQMFGNGILDHRRAISWDTLKNLRIPVPPVAEQEAIVKYLAHANARIDKAIAVKRRLITLLREHVATLRHEAFGADTGRWPVLRLKTLLSRIDQGVSPQAENQLPSENEWGVLKAGCVNGGVFRPEQIKRLPDGFDVPESLSVENGDILVARASGSPNLVGSTARVADFQGNAILSDKTFRLVPRPLLDPDYLVMAMNSYSYRQQVRGAISGAEGLANNLPLTALRTFQFALPPIHEQREIVERLATESKSSSDTIVRIEHEITLLQEFRTRLVADVVTGQVDVRAIAATLPDAPQSFDNMFSSIDDDLEEALSEGEE